jgi:hypothetical protein
MPNPHTGMRVHPFLAGAALLLAPAVPAQLTWTQLTTANAPPALAAPAAALSLYEHHLALFGGLGAAGATGGTWVLTAQGWTQATPVPSPPARSHAAMATIGSALALFGGRGAPGNALADCWAWQPVGATWTAVAGGPAARERAAFAGRTEMGDALLFGGHDGATVFGDTWQLALSAVPPWTQLNLVTAPPARHGHALASLGGSPRRVVLFGGIAAGGNHLDDTWVFEQPVGGAAQWIAMQPAARPSPRAGHAMRFAWHRGRVQLFGGEGPNGLLGDTWEWDGTNWIAIATAGAPGPRADAVFVDAAHNPAAAPWDGLLLGGRDANGPLAEVWQVTSTVPATSAQFAGFVPSLFVQPLQGQPWLGGSFVYQVNGPLAPMVAPHLIAGFSNTTSALGPLPLNLGPALDGATLLVDPVVVLGLPFSGGTFTYTTITLPPAPSLAGTHLYLQAIAWLPTVFNGRWGVSAGVDCVLGWR